MEDKIIEYLTEIIQRITKVEDKLSEYNVILKDHIKRTNILENRVEEIEKDKLQISTIIWFIVKTSAIIAAIVGFVFTLRNIWY